MPDPALNSFHFEGAFDPGLGNKSHRETYQSGIFVRSGESPPVAREGRGREGGEHPRRGGSEREAPSAGGGRAGRVVGGREKGRKREEEANDREFRAGFADRCAH